MKKILINLMLISGVAVSLVACGGGGGGGGGPSPSPSPSSSPAPSPAPAPSTAPVSPPEGSTPAVSGGGTPVYYNVSSGVATISLPQTSAGGTSFTSITLPSGTETDNLVAALQGGTVTNVVTSGSNIVFQTATMAYVVNDPNITTQSAKKLTTTSTTVNSAAVSNATTAILPAAFGSFTGVLYGNSSKTLVASPYTGTVGGDSYSLSGCSGSAAGTPQALATATYGGSSYVGVGDSNGNVCILNATANPPQWTNLTPQAVSHGYTATSLKAFSFTNLDNQVLYGYWLTSNGQIWRVTAHTKGQPITSSSCTGNSNCSFWQVNKAGQQTSGGQSVTFYNGPDASLVNSIYSDLANSLFVGATNGNVYKLAAVNGTNWSTPASVLAPGQAATSVNVSATSTGFGATAAVGNSVSVVQ